MSYGKEGRPELELMGQPIGRNRFFVIGGPCVIENEQMVMRIAGFLKETCTSLNIPFVFKSSYDKANRTSLESYRGPGLEAGLAVLARVRHELRIPVVTDVHSAQEVPSVEQVADIIQIPAFLARQTDLLVAAARTGKPLNLKKAQFMAPWDMTQAVHKVLQTGGSGILLTERGTLFGYNNLVVDMRSLCIMAETGFPVVFDATHSVQLPGGLGTSSGGQRQYVAPLARAAVAAGAHGVFLEMHEDPDRALCDGANSLALEQVPPLLETLLEVYSTVHGQACEGRKKHEAAQ